MNVVDDAEITASLVGDESAYRVKETVKNAYSSYENKKSYKSHSSKIVNVSSIENKHYNQ